MNIFGDNTIKYMILTALSEGPKTSVDLIDEIKNKRPGATKQGVYKALRSLLQSENVVKYRKSLVLNQLWLNKIGAFLRQTNKNYLVNKRSKKSHDSIDWMQEGSKLSLAFKSYEVHDKFYSHLFSLIIQKTDPRSPIYVYNPHEWFILGVNLKKNEDYLFNWLGEIGRQLYFTVGYNTSLDKKFREKYESDEIQIALDEKMKFPKNYSVNVIGNYIAESRSDMGFAENIHNIYENTANYDEAGESVRKLLQKKYKLKMIISYNPERAKKLKDKLAKNFFIPKELRDK